ncbi:probable NAD(P)H dehydrogenase subunit CRR3, chloroplastic [Macadamia integrifolia]|uniref:probable NAD(P)H dehydrogenase subunit CRR3, chloroplastic n=1 Tax=Macadamia integrifolia TaxID=60698 RepID=UPI001C4FC52E|nr:probable NAD(P)H dehydrogenase subunit CRR3, chloroplastic [Macadamia integrifolia]
MGSLGCLSLSLSTTTTSRCRKLTVLATPSESPTQAPDSPTPPTPKKSNLAGFGGVRSSRNGAVKTPKQRQPSIAEVERAIGAGIFRDDGSPTTRDSSESSTILDMFLSTKTSRPEGSVEKKLRETGEWLIDSSKGKSGSAGQEILLVVSLWILPVWMFFLFVASGVIKLPSSIRFLDDLIM